ncbi:hypothetical protein Taro_035992, partial [Colocasia esculenta]|nr:hypothetical protein [Colocasia esculenta]
LPASPPVTTMELDEAKNTKNSGVVECDPSSSVWNTWMPSSKMRLLKRMTTNSDGLAGGNPRTATAVLRFRVLHEQPFTGSSYKDNSYSTASISHHHHHHQRSTVADSTARICSDCNNTKTPLWRSGPRGPKYSVCNACGIRRIRKARRVSMAAAASQMTDRSILPLQVPASKSPMKKRSDDSEPCTIPFKKRCGFDPTQQELQLEEFKASALSKNKASHGVFPQDEEEAAVLLMALSCGLICGE